MRALIAGLCVAVLAGPVVAAEEGACYVAGSLVHADFALPRTVAAIEAKHVSVVVIGSASSTLPGAEGVAKAYPARLQESLTRRLPGVTVNVVAHTKARETAAEMVKTLRQVVNDEKPDLVVWQTGTVDAMRFVALQREIPLFDRLGVMKDWNEMGVFDLSTATKKIDVAERVHDCIGRMLARLVVDGAMLAKTGNTGVGIVDGLNKDSH